MSILTEKTKRLWKNNQELWLKEIVKDNLAHKLVGHNFQDNNEWTASDYEQSPLSQIIWGEIISSYLSKKYGEEYAYLINSYYLTVQSDTKSFRFLVDAMNNGKVAYNPSYGTKDNSDIIYKYHYIGNFTPIPGNVPLKRSLQFIHRGFQEDWNKMIKYIRDNWNDFKFDLTFDEYIEMTFQTDYYLNKEFNEIIGKENIKNMFISRGERIEGWLKELLLNKYELFK